MAVADVFDAISAKCCYSKAMPLAHCYKIIRDGSGENFDPDIVETFLSGKVNAEKIYYSKQ